MKEVNLSNPTPVAADLLTVADVAKRLASTPKHVYDLIAIGQLHAHNTGTSKHRASWRIHPADLEEYLRLCRT
jgi:excisionase family DNA binding protein